MMRWMRILLTMGLVALLALSVGCSDSDDTGDPTDTTGPPTGTQFDEPTAILLAQANAASAAGTVALTTGLAGGFDVPSSDREGEVWNDTLMQWEWSDTFSEGDMGWSYDYTLQYLDANGDPQMEPNGAESMRYTWTGTFSSANAGTSIVYEYNYDVIWTGLGTAAWLMDGSGWYSYSIVIEVSGQEITTEFVTSWETVAPGISIPSGRAGCPTGSILYDMDPYSMTVNFDGSDTYTYSMEDASGNDVPLNPNESQVGCTP